MRDPTPNTEDLGAPEGQRFYDLYRSAAGKQLFEWGLLYMAAAPRPNEVCVLFEAEKLAKALDSSNLAATWRADIGPFVGFDANLRLIVEQDLVWWRLENPELSPRVGTPTAVASDPTGRKKVSLGPAARQAKKPASQARLSLPTTKPRAGKNPMLTLTFREHTLYSNDAHMLGVAARIAGVSSVLTDLERGPFEPLVLSARKRNCHEELCHALKRDDFRRTPLVAFHQALCGATVRPDAAAAALELLPEALRPQA